MKLTKNKLVISFILIFSMVLLTACSSTNKNEDSSTNESTNRSSDDNMDMSSEDMDEMHSGTEEVPEDLKVKENPTYEVGSQAIINAEHMTGMKDAEATIVGAYDTTVYTISYTPTNGGKKVENHKWVIQEEIDNAGEEPLEPGTKVTIDAEHMTGMEGANATIDSAEKTTVYMVDYTSTTDGEKVTNHKWVTESELSVKE
jgi:hypothetical protein